MALDQSNERSKCNLRLPFEIEDFFSSVQNHVNRRTVLALLWRETWDDFLFSQSHYDNNFKETSNNGGKNEPVPLKHPLHDLWERHCENKSIEAQVGLDVYRHAVNVRQQMGAQYDEIVKRCILEFDACSDVVWDGCQSQTPGKVQRQDGNRFRFGRIHVNPFPFEARFYYDDCDDITVFSFSHEHGAVHLQRLMNINTFDEDVIVERQLRSALRCLAWEQAENVNDRSITSPSVSKILSNRVVKRSSIAPIDLFCSADGLKAVNSAMANLRQETYNLYQFRQSTLPYEFHVNIYHNVYANYDAVLRFFKPIRRQCALYDLIVRSSAVRNFVDSIQLLHSCSTRKVIFWAFFADLHQCNKFDWRAQRHDCLLAAFDPINVRSIAFQGDSIRCVGQFTDALKHFVDDDEILITVLALPLQKMFDQFDSIDRI